MWTLARVSAVAALAWVLLSMAGCGDAGRLVSVTGEVGFADGRPVRNASIEFVPEAGGPSPRGLIDAEGHFELGTFGGADGATPGDYRVVVVQAIPPGAAWVASSLGEEHQRHADDVPLVSLKHAATATTGIAVSVEPGKPNRFEIVVDSQ